VESGGWRGGVWGVEGGWKDARDERVVLIINQFLIPTSRRGGFRLSLFYVHNEQFQCEIYDDKNRTVRNKVKRSVTCLTFAPLTIFLNDEFAVLSLLCTVTYTVEGWRDGGIKG
jgi:hypothetical protein